MAKVNTNTSKPLTTFTEFPELIPEIRLAIWEFVLDAILPPRVIEIFSSTHDCMHHNKRNNAKSRSGGRNAEFYTKTPYPIALCINRESRELGLKRYELLEARRDEELLFRTWIRYSTDTIYIHPFHIVASAKLMDETRFMQVMNLFLVYSDARLKIQRLAISQFCFPFGVRPVSGFGSILAFTGLVTDGGLLLTVGDVCCGGRGGDDGGAEVMSESLHRKVVGFSKAKRSFHPVAFWEGYANLMRLSLVWGVERRVFLREWSVDVLDLERVETRICVVQREVKLAFFQDGGGGGDGELELELELDRHRRQLGGGGGGFRGFCPCEVE